MCPLCLHTLGHGVGGSAPQLNKTRKPMAACPMPASYLSRCRGDHCPVRSSMHSAGGRRGRAEVGLFESAEPIVSFGDLRLPRSRGILDHRNGPKIAGADSFGNAERMATVAPAAASNRTTFAATAPVLLFMGDEPLNGLCVVARSTRGGSRTRRTTVRVRHREPCRLARAGARTAAR